MAGLVPAIHVLVTQKRKQDVDARAKRGHDGGMWTLDCFASVATKAQQLPIT
jgi:hypothetical protein